jgi:hypothetical protein
MYRIPWCSWRLCERQILKGHHLNIKGAFWGIGWLLREFYKLRAARIILSGKIDCNDSVLRSRQYSIFFFVNSHEVKIYAMIKYKVVKVTFVLHISFFNETEL